MTLWFTADQHYDHEKGLFEYFQDTRPFATIEEMNETIIARHNEVVSHGDDVYYLGDLAWGDAGRVFELFGRLKGRIHCVEGNHDRQWWQKPVRYVSASGHPIEYLMPLHIMKFRYGSVKKYITLCHYAMRSWYKSFKGGWHLYGHSHGNLPSYGKSFDVGVDCHNLYPVSAAQVVDIMSTLRYVSSADFEDDEEEENGFE